MNIPLLMPSGPIYSLKYVDCDPPKEIRYDSYKYRSRILGYPHPLELVSKNNRQAIEEAPFIYVLDIDKGTPWGRKWASIRKWWAIHIQSHLPGDSWAQMLTRAESYPQGGSKMSWRCEIGPENKPWHTGDNQPQDGYWPISIAVFDRVPGDGQDFVSKGYPYGDIE